MEQSNVMSHSSRSEVSAASSPADTASDNDRARPSLTPSRGSRASSSLSSEFCCAPVSSLLLVVDPLLLLLRVDILGGRGKDEVVLLSFAPVLAADDIDELAVVDLLFLFIVCTSPCHKKSAEAMQVKTQDSFHQFQRGGCSLALYSLPLLLRTTIANSF